VLIVGPDEVIRHANPAAERVFGRRASVLVGMRLPEVLQNAHRMRPDTAFDLRTGLGERLGVAWKLLARHGSGALVPVLVTSVPLGSGPDASRAVRVRDVSLEPKRAGQAGADST
jgi:PAS domain S-box-containing protein